MTETKSSPLTTAALKDTVAPSACLVCSAGDPRRHLEASDYVTGEKFAVYLCERCGVGFTWPQPRDLNRYYAAEYRAFPAWTKWILRSLYRMRVSKWARELGRPGFALEVGCGEGWMLKALHDRGWRVLGLERTQKQARNASLLTGLEVSSVDLGDIKPEGRFALIIMFNVLEHMRDPARALRQCSRLLHAGGALILSMPNLASWQAKMTGASWFHLDVPRHLFHFSEAPLGELLNREGFDLVKAEYTYWIHDPFGWVQSVLNCLGFRPNQLMRGLMGGDRGKLFNPLGVVMLLLSVLLVPPSLILSMLSWSVGRGAVFQVWARKRE